MPDPTATGAGNPLGDLTRAGVHLWLGNLIRAHQSTGGLARLVKQRHVTGATINATFLVKALRADADHGEQVRELTLRGTSVGDSLAAAAPWATAG
jgi:transaldolase